MLSKSMLKVSFFIFISLLVLLLLLLNIVLISLCKFLIRCFKQKHSGIHQLH